MKLQARTILLFLFIAFGSYNLIDYVGHMLKVNSTIDTLATEILEGNFKSIVYVGSSTQEEIKDLNLETTKFETELWDCDLGNGSADAVIIYIQDKNPELGLRVKYDSSLNKYHILGYWTL